VSQSTLILLTVETTEIDANVLLELTLKRLESVQKENLILQAQVISLQKKLDQKEDY
jgi:hypothetical protein